MSSDLLPNRIAVEARESRELRRRLYLAALWFIVPAALVTAQATFPQPGFMRDICMAVTAGWAVLLLGLTFRWIGNFVVEWGTYLLGALIFLVVLISTVLNWNNVHSTAFLGASSLLPAWAFLALRDKWGLRVSLVFYFLVMGIWSSFALPALLNGSFATSYLALTWKTYVYYFALTPVYIMVISALAVINRHQSQRRLKAVTEYAYQDALTGLPNRRAFQEHLEGAVAEALKSGGGGTLALLNINGFTALNNELGHTAGDVILRTLAARWQETITAGAHLSRMSGDEFGLILPTAQAAEVLAQVQALVKATEEPIDLNGVRRTVSVRFGLVSFPEFGETASAVTSAADTAQAHARLHGPVVVYNAELADQASRRTAILTALPEALRAQQFQLVYQPILALHSGELQSVEALIRWNSPITPNPTPDEFIALAEEAHLIEAIGEWVMRTALKQMRAWHDAGVVVPRINVNVAPQELLREGYATRVLRLLREVQLPPEKLELELTERSILETPAVVELQFLRQVGVNIAIDDFGTGHSSLAWLHSLPITCVKIDRRFTGMLGQDGAAYRLSTTVLNLANSLNLEVVAEGVETEEQAAMLRSLNCPMGQGYLFSRPLSAVDFEAFLRERRGEPLAKERAGGVKLSNGQTV